MKQDLGDMVIPYLFLCWGYAHTTKAQFLEKLKTYCKVTSGRNKEVFDYVSLYGEDMYIEWSVGLGYIIHY